MWSADHIIHMLASRILKKKICYSNLCRHTIARLSYLTFPKMEIILLKNILIDWKKLWNFLIVAAKYVYSPFWLVFSIFSRDPKRLHSNELFLECNHSSAGKYCSLFAQSTRNDKQSNGCTVNLILMGSCNFQYS